MDKMNMGNYAIWLTGSKKRIQRTVWRIDKKYFVKWYGNMIEVARGQHHFYTIESY